MAKIGTKNNVGGWRSLTAEEIEMIRTAARTTWSYVGPEFSALCGGSCTMAERAEAIFDADRIGFYNRDEFGRLKSERALQFGAALKKLYALKWPAVIEFTRLFVFPER